jgi:hypothetical protein
MDLTRVLDMALLSQLVYKTEDEVRADSPYPVIDFRSIQNTNKVYVDTQFGVFRDLTRDGKSTNDIIVAFRGTKELADILTDINAFKAEFKQVGGKVHKGFLEAYLAVRAIIFDILVNKRPDSLTITGHSLGAALATLAAVDIAKNLKLRVTCINFGCPRVGNKEFADLVSQFVPSFLRIVDGADIATVLPPRILGYKHGTKKVMICKPALLSLLEIITAQTTGLARAKRVLAFHYLDHYIARLVELVEIADE